MAEWIETDRIRREQLTPSAVEPEWQFWTREDEWALYDAALLLVNVEPRQALGLLLTDLGNSRKAVKSSMQVLPISARTSAVVGRHRQLYGGFIVEDLTDETKSKLDTVEEITRRALIANRRGRLAMDNEAVAH